MVFTHRLNELLGADRRSLDSLSEPVDMVQNGSGYFYWSDWWNIYSAVGDASESTNRGWVDSSRSYMITRLGISAHSFDGHLWMRWDHCCSRTEDGIVHMGGWDVKQWWCSSRYAIMSIRKFRLQYNFLSMAFYVLKESLRKLEMYLACI